MPDTFYLQEVLPPYLHIIFDPKFVAVLMVILLVLVLVSIFTKGIRFIAQLKQKNTFLEVIPPYNNTQSILSTQYFFTVTHSLLAPRSIFEKFFKVKKLISCELVSSKEDGIRYILKIPQGEISAIKKNLRAHIPGVEIKEVTDYLSGKHIETAIQDLQLSRSFFFPLTTNHSLEQIDPVSCTHKFYINRHFFIPVSGCFIVTEYGCFSFYHA